MAKRLKEFLRDEGGQDLIEYTLLLAFVALASAALFVDTGKSVDGIWRKGNEILRNGSRKTGPTPLN